MTKYKRQPMATKLPGIRFDIFTFVFVVLCSAAVGFSISFFVMNPCELVNFTDDYCEAIQLGVRG